jgi:hypothetical protein
MSVAYMNVLRFEYEAWSKNRSMWSWRLVREWNRKTALIFFDTILHFEQQTMKYYQLFYVIEGQWNLELAHNLVFVH